MPLTPAAAWSEAVLRVNPKFHYIVEIDNGVTTWSAASGPVAEGYPEAVRNVSNFGVELDSLIREPEAGEIKVEVDDLWLRPIMVNNRLKRQKLTVKAGTDLLAEASFLTVFVGTIESFQVKPADGSIIVEAIHGFTALDRAEIVGNWIGEHPLVVAKDIIVNYAGWPAALVDNNSFDPTQAVYAAVGHYVVTRRSQGNFDLGVSKPTSALRLVTELLQLLNAQLVVNDEGEFAVVMFNSAASADDSWTEDDIIPGSFEQEALDDNILNRAVIRFGRWQDLDEYHHSYEENDTGSQANYGIPGGAGAGDGVLSFGLDTNWLDDKDRMGLWQDIAAGAVDIYINQSLHAVCGTNSVPVTAPAGQYAVSAARPLYFLLYDSTGYEIIKSTVVSFPAPTYEDEVLYIDPSDGTTVQTSDLFWGKMLLDAAGVSRAQLGTTAKAFVAGGAGSDPATVIDITIPVLLAKALLERHSVGSARIKLQTRHDKMIYQVGDIINVTAPEFVAYGADGLDGSEKFEILGKELQFDSNPPVVEWTLQSIAISTPTREGMARTNPDSDFRRRMRARTNNTVRQAFIQSGFVVTDAGGLDISISAGDAVVDGEHSSLSTARTRTLAASTTHYVAWNAARGRVAYSRGTAFTSDPEMIAIATVVVGVAAITSITDTRVFDEVKDEAIGIQGVNRDQEVGLSVNLNSLIFAVY